MTPHLSLGGEVFWAGQHRKSGIGYAARYNTDKMVYLLKLYMVVLGISVIFVILVFTSPLKKNLLGSK